MRKVLFILMLFISLQTMVQTFKPSLLSGCVWMAEAELFNYRGNKWTVEFSDSIYTMTLLFSHNGETVVKDSRSLTPYSSDAERLASIYSFFHCI